MRTKKYYGIVRLLMCLGLIVSLCGCGEKVDERNYSIVVEYEELEKLAGQAQNDDAMIIIDLRDNSDYEYAHLDGSVNVPFDENGEWLVRYSEENHLQDKEIYLLCGAGKKSAKAFNLLVEKGYRKVHYVSFGFVEYQEKRGDASLSGAGVCDCVKKQDGEDKN